jgi:hypothetical protein
MVGYDHVETEEYHENLQSRWQVVRLTVETCASRIQVAYNQIQAVQTATNGFIY